MVALVLIVLSLIAIMILAVIARELYYTKPGLDLNLRRFEEMVGLEILILTSIVIVIKFV